MSARWDALVLAVTVLLKDSELCAAWRSSRCAEGKTAVTLALVASDRGQRQTLDGIGTGSFQSK